MENPENLQYDRFLILQTLNKKSTSKQSKQGERLLEI